jgi:hypothetical protein
MSFEKDLALNDHYFSQLHIEEIDNVLNNNLCNILGEHGQKLRILKPLTYGPYFAILEYFILLLNIVSFSI